MFSLNFKENAFSLGVRRLSRNGGVCARNDSLILPFLQYREYFFSYTMDFEKSGAATKNDV